VVTLLVTVRDRDGTVIKNLNQRDFTLEEDGRPQTIRYFSRETDLPLTLGLLVDTSQNQVDVLEPERLASYAFLDRMLRPDRDLAFVAHFDYRVELLEGFTGSREKLRAALAELRSAGENQYALVRLRETVLRRFDGTNKKGAKRSLCSPTAAIFTAGLRSARRSSMPSVPTPAFTPFLTPHASSRASSNGGAGFFQGAG
jgi:VWFA-related protein